MSLCTPRLSARISHRLARHIPVEARPLRKLAPMVSFTFDDVPQSALTAGAGLLEEHGAHGTFYVAGGLLGAVTPDWRVIDGDGVCELAQRGHEIGCHTFAHLRADGMDPARIAEDAARNRAVLRAIVPELTLENFAYPFGYGSFAWKRRLAKLFRSSRAIVSGINAGRIDTQFLRAMPMMQPRLDKDAIARLMDRVCEARGWLIFYSHDVAQRPSEHGCTPELLACALRAAEARGIACATVGEAMDRIAA